MLHTSLKWCDKDWSSICAVLDGRQWENPPRLYQHSLSWLSQVAVNDPALLPLVLNRLCHYCWHSSQGPLAKMLCREVGHVLQTLTFAPWAFGVGYFKFWKPFGKDLFIALHLLQKTHFTATQAFPDFSALFEVLVIHDIHLKSDYFHPKTVLSKIF